MDIDKNPKYSPQPCLGFVLVGQREDSQLYVKMKKKACDEIGIAIKGKVAFLCWKQTTSIVFESI